MNDLPTWIEAIGTTSVAAVALRHLGYERRKSRLALHRSQAQQVSAWLGDEGVSERGGEVTTVHLLNSSREPVYRALACFVFVQGAGPMATEDMLRLRLGESPEAHDVEPWTTVRLIPPGEWTVSLPGRGWETIMQGRGGIDLAFTDRFGGHWIRRATGRLDEIGKPPLEYFGEFKLHGPYDLVRPTPAVSQAPHVWG